MVQALADILCWVRRLWEIHRVTSEGSERDRGNERAKVEEERVETSTQANRGEDTKTNPV